MSIKTILWWVRRDLRLHDNIALHTALNQATHVVPCFVLDPAILNAATFSPQRFAFLIDGLHALDADLRARGSYLVVRRGSPQTELRQLMSETNGMGIVAERDYSPYAVRRDSQLSAELPLTLTRGLTVRPPEAVQKKAGGTYTIFTPFKKTWLKLPLPRRQQLIPPPTHIETPANLPSESLPAVKQTTPHFPSGTAEAHRRLQQFANHRLYRYGDERDRVDLNGTSSLSPYLRFGMLSARHAVITAIDAMSDARSEAQRSGAETWLSELIWREFYHQILFHHPHVRRGSFRPVYDQIAWRNDLADFEAWKMGRTGYPIIDAAMRQLQHTGWMHNRARMIVASFLTKDLLINWQWGERWFMQCLVDGDHAANNGGWQWAAGTGTDAAPYFRIFNPITQGKKFDPDGAYVRRWVPELADVPAKLIHEPWKMGPMEQPIRNCVLGQHYPKRIVDHKWARNVTLAAYKKARAGAA